MRLAFTVEYYFNRRFSYASASSQYQVRTPLMKQLATDPSQLGDHPVLSLVPDNAVVPPCGRAAIPVFRLSPHSPHVYSPFFPSHVEK